MASGFGTKDPSNGAAGWAGPSGRPAFTKLRIPQWAIDGAFGILRIPSQGAQFPRRVHELGHVIGLNHVTDPMQLMYAEKSGQLDFGADDRAGLAFLGTGKRVPRL